ncbi:tryptase beta-2 [Drosophila erecta]|uniref:tryptase beta-2 n=1 Tax=Drosophila erecta TaxID=7220 RepID=UPI000F04924E|nr:tryptase beta-2 [Drosophila erecta]
MLKNWTINTFLFVFSWFSVTGQYDAEAPATLSGILPTDNLHSDPNQVCGPSNPNGLLANVELPASLICAGGEMDAGDCFGDGGSALFCPMETDPSRYEQTSIVNWGIGCRQENVPAVYTNVQMFRDWILLHLAQNSNSVPFAG